MTNGRMSIVFLVLSLFAVPGACFAGTRFCDDASAKLAARAYVLSFPILGQDSKLDELITKNRPLFVSEGAVTRCMRATGTALIEASIANYRQNKPGRSATEIWGGRMPEGLGHLPGQVDSAMQQGGLEFLTMGQELIWLSQVLPAALQGNPALYNAHNTTWRQSLNQMVPSLQMLCSMDASTCDLFKNTMASVVPIVEQQVFSLATGQY